MDYCVNCQAPRVENRYSKPSYVPNAVATTAGLAVTGVTLTKGIRQAKNVCSDAIALSNGSKIIGTKTGKIFAFFEKAGEKIFKDGTKLGNAMKRYVTGKSPSGGVLCEPKQIAAILKRNKTIGAMALAAGFAALNLLILGARRAGQIDAKRA